MPEGTDLASFESVIIWCEQFNVLISPADLAFKKLLTIRQASHENREDRRFQL
ncbi:MAG: DM13 domain-containing protein [Pseudomonadota bacterium]|nr:DM13 domain-containing protein [Pseudomonadota bacterium]